MANLRLFMPKADDPAVLVHGDIWAQNAPDDAKPIVSDVIARISSGSRFVLNAGDYTFRFNIESGSGKLTVEIDDSDTNKAVVTKEFDTADAVRGRTLRFTI